MRKLTLITGLLVASGLVLGASGSSNALAVASADSWRVDEAHTEVNFSVKHFFTPVNGSFRDFEVDLAFDADNPENSSVSARIAVGSVDTGNDRRDNHLRSADWFEADAHPDMTFESTSVRQVGEGRLIARGPLTIKGVSREIELPISLLGTQPIPEQMREMLGGATEIASFRAETSVDRGEFGVGVGSWAATLVVGSAVEIEIVLEAAAQ